MTTIRINKTQIARIHILKGKLGMDDESYRCLLENFRCAVSPAKYCTSSTDLSWSDANQFIRMLEDACRKCGVKIQRVKKKYAGEKRPDIWASPAQKRMIEALWKDYCDILIDLDSDRADLATPEGRDHALTNWLHHRWLFGGIETLPRKSIGKVKAALEQMIRQEQNKTDKQKELS